jgi:hypothetical protein
VYSLVYTISNACASSITKLSVCGEFHLRRGGGGLQGRIRVVTGLQVFLIEERVMRYAEARCSILVQ